MTQKEKLAGKELLKMLKEFEGHYDKLPKKNKIKESKYQEWHKHYCAGARFAMSLAVVLLQLFLDGRLEKAMKGGE